MSKPGRRSNESFAQIMPPSTEGSEAGPRQLPRQKSLIDTSEWLREVSEVYGMQQVLTVRGKRDSNNAKLARVASGRHLLIAANEAGEAFFFLNSHSKARRAHMGLGLWCSEAFLIGPSKPIQRWKGHRKVLGELIPQLEDLRAVKEILAAWNCPPGNALALATVVAKAGYFARVAIRPSPEVLIGGFNGNMLDTAFEIVRRMRRGDLAPVERGSCSINPVEQPDGLFHAGLVCFDTAVTLAKDAGLAGEEINFGDIYARRVRE
jgi:hypothetical protein